MRKYVALILAVSLIVLPAVSVSAAEVAESPVPDTMVGYAIDEDGNRYEIIGELVNTTMPRTSDGVHSATYAYDIQDYNEIYHSDDGYSSTVYLTVYYTIRDNFHYLLTAVSGHWVIHDYRVSVIDSKVTYASGVYHRVANAPVSNNFYINTGFTNFTEDNGSYSTVGATIYLTYLMGSSRTWTYELQNKVFG